MMNRHAFNRDVILYGIIFLTGAILLREDYFSKPVVVWAGIINFTINGVKAKMSKGGSVKNESNSNSQST